jgi:hypothetical protein
MSPRQSRLKPLARRAVLCAILIPLFTPWTAELYAQSVSLAFELPNCHETRPKIAGRKLAHGDVTRRFLNCFEEVLTTLDTLSTAANQDRAELVQPLLDLYRQLVPETMELLEQAFLQLSPQDLADVERRVLNSNLFEEAIALETFLNAPPELISTDEKQDKATIVEDSIKALIESILDALKAKLNPVPLPRPVPVPGMVKSIFGVLNEILKLLTR